ncbi:MAG: hypothetical protein MJ181_01340 [Treponema sp.]|nr:hypothetical protein [Treponema sp.]
MGGFIFLPFLFYLFAFTAFFVSVSAPMSELKTSVYFKELLSSFVIVPHFIDVTGIEMAQPLADFYTFIISVPFYFWMAKKLTSSV